jgi:hypothetical protein
MGSQSIPAGAPPPAPGEPWRPPLAKNLFRDRHHVLGDIVRSYPKLAHILPYLREPTKGRSLEQMLESLQEEGKGNPESQREFASVRFYLCELLQRVTEEWSLRTDGATNYAPLVRDVLRFCNPGDRVCLVTFNYDMLLERVLSSFEFKNKPPEAHLDSHPILKLFKLHGSVGWSRLVDIPPRGMRFSPQGIIERADTMQLSDKFVLANPTNPHEMHNFGNPIIPAIAIPVQTKSDQDFECPITHLNYFTEMLPHVTKVLIIGWQAKEAHFLRMLRSKLPNLKHVMVVGADATDAKGTLKYFVGEIGQYVASQNQSVGQGGFTDFIVNEEGLPFYRA